MFPPVPFRFSRPLTCCPSVMAIVGLSANTLKAIYELDRLEGERRRTGRVKPNGGGGGIPAPRTSTPAMAGAAAASSALAALSLAPLARASRNLRPLTRSVTTTPLAITLSPVDRVSSSPTRVPSPRIENSLTRSTGTAPAFSPSSDTAVAPFEHTIHHQRYVQKRAESIHDLERQRAVAAARREKEAEWQRQQQERQALRRHDRILSQFDATAADLDSELAAMSAHYDQVGERGLLDPATLAVPSFAEHDAALIPMIGDECVFVRDVCVETVGPSSSATALPNAALEQASSARSLLSGKSQPRGRRTSKNNSDAVSVRGSGGHAASAQPPPDYKIGRRGWIAGMASADSTCVFSVTSAEVSTSVEKANASRIVTEPTHDPTPPTMLTPPRQESMESATTPSSESVDVASSASASFSIRERARPPPASLLGSGAGSGGKEELTAPSSAASVSASVLSLAPAAHSGLFAPFVVDDDGRPLSLLSAQTTIEMCVAGAVVTYASSWIYQPRATATAVSEAGSRSESPRQAALSPAPAALGNTGSGELALVVPYSPTDIRLVGFEADVGADAIRSGVVPSELARRAESASAEQRASRLTAELATQHSAASSSASLMGAQGVGGVQVASQTSNVRYVEEPRDDHAVGDDGPRRRAQAAMRAAGIWSDCFEFVMNNAMGTDTAAAAAEAGDDQLNHSPSFQLLPLKRAVTSSGTSRASSTFNIPAMAAALGGDATTVHVSVTMFAAAHLVMKKGGRERSTGGQGVSIDTASVIVNVPHALPPNVEGPIPVSVTGQAAALPSRKSTVTNVAHARARRPSLSGAALQEASTVTRVAPAPTCAFVIVAPGLPPNAPLNFYPSCPHTPTLQSATHQGMLVARPEEAVRTSEPPTPAKSAGQLVAIRTGRSGAALAVVPPASPQLPPPAAVPPCLVAAVTIAKSDDLSVWCASDSCSSTPRTECFLATAVASTALEAHGFARRVSLHIDLAAMAHDLHSHITKLGGALNKATRDGEDDEHEQPAAVHKSIGDVRQLQHAVRRSVEVIRAANRAVLQLLATLEPRDLLCLNLQLNVNVDVGMVRTGLRSCGETTKVAYSALLSAACQLVLSLCGAVIAASDREASSSSGAPGQEADQAADIMNFVAVGEKMGATVEPGVMSSPSEPPPPGQLLNSITAVCLEEEASASADNSRTASPTQTPLLSTSATVVAFEASASNAGFMLAPAQLSVPGQVVEIILLTSGRCLSRHNDVVDLADTVEHVVLDYGARCHVFVLSSSSSQHPLDDSRASSCGQQQVLPDAETGDRPVTFAEVRDALFGTALTSRGRCAEGLTSAAVFRFFDLLQRPVIVDIDVRFPSQTGAMELFFGAPDLCVNVPLVLAGRFKTQGAGDGASEAMQLTGRLVNGRTWRRKQPCFRTTMPLARLTEPLRLSSQAQIRAFKSFITLSARTKARMQGVNIWDDLVNESCQMGIAVSLPEGRGTALVVYQVSRAGGGSRTAADGGGIKRVFPPTVSSMPPLAAPPTTGKDAIAGVGGWADAMEKRVKRETAVCGVLCVLSAPAGVEFTRRLSVGGRLIRWLTQRCWLWQDRVHALLVDEASQRRSVLKEEFSHRLEAESRFHRRRLGIAKTAVLWSRGTAVIEEHCRHATGDLRRREQQEWAALLEGTEDTRLAMQRENRFTAERRSRIEHAEADGRLAVLREQQQTADIVRLSLDEMFVPSRTFIAQVLSTMRHAEDDTVESALLASTLALWTRREPIADSFGLMGLAERVRDLIVLHGNHHPDMVVSLCAVLVHLSHIQTNQGALTSINVAGDLLHVLAVHSTHLPLQRTATHCLAVVCRLAQHACSLAVTSPIGLVRFGARVPRFL